MENESHYLKVGLFVLCAVVASILTLAFFSTRDSINHYITYAIYFEGDVSGLGIGSAVRFKGINVGRVKDISFVSYDDDKIRILADIVDTAPIRKDTTAMVRLQGITGTSVISLENTGEDSSALAREDGADYMVIRSTPSQLEKFFNDLPNLIAAMTTLAERGQLLLNDENIEAFNGALKSTASLANSGSRLLGSQTSTELHEMLVEAKIALREFKMLAKSLREDPSKILRSPKHEGYTAND